MSPTLSLIDFKLLRGGGGVNRVSLAVDQLLVICKWSPRNCILYYLLPFLVFTGLGLFDV